MTRQRRTRKSVARLRCEHVSRNHFWSWHGSWKKLLYESWSSYLWGCNYTFLAISHTTSAGAWSFSRRIPTIQVIFRFINLKLLTTRSSHATTVGFSAIARNQVSLPGLPKGYASVGPHRPPLQLQSMWMAILRRNQSKKLQSDTESIKLPFDDALHSHTWSSKVHSATFYIDRGSCTPWRQDDSDYDTGCLKAGLNPRTANPTVISSYSVDPLTVAIFTVTRTRA